MNDPNQKIYGQVREELVLKGYSYKTFLWAKILQRPEHLLEQSGLRVSEVDRLQLCDINSKRKLIKVRQGKGRKDRYTLLSEVALKQLKKYYMLYKR